MLLIWKLAWDMPMNDRKGNEYHAINNTIDKHLVVRVVAQSEVYAIHG